MNENRTLYQDKGNLETAIPSGSSIFILGIYWTTTLYWHVLYGDIVSRLWNCDESWMQSQQHVTKCLLEEVIGVSMMLMEAQDGNTFLSCIVDQLQVWQNEVLVI